MAPKSKLSEAQQRVVYHANDILWLWRDLVQADPKGDGWYEHRARQAYQDCLQSLNAHGLIDSYDVVNVRVLIGDRWYNDRRGLEFIQTGPSVPVS